MKRTALLVLLAANCIMLAAVAALWVTTDQRWQPPASQRPDAASFAPETLELEHAELPPQPESLRRPLFSPTRTPAPEAPDGTVQIGEFAPVLLGVFDAKGAGRGAILRVDKKVHRIALGEALGPWTLQSLDGDGKVVFRRADEEVELQLRHLPQTAAADSPTRSGAAPSRNQSAGAATGPDSKPMSLAERIAERLRRGE